MNPPAKPRRILAIDGGGIRGVFSLQVLARIEELFRAERNRPDLVLADEVAFFAGTSTGAIIATCLSWGMSVREIERLYIEHSEEMFAPRAWLERWKTKYDPKAISLFLRNLFCEDDPARTPALFGSRKLRTLLLVVLRNATTGSPWPVSNNPHAIYNDRTRATCNMDIPIWKIVRASTAAPTFFPPEAVTIGGRTHLFVDGGITPYNNPALIAVLMATLPSYRIGWDASPEQLQLISLGTGRMRPRLPDKLAAEINLIEQLKFLAPALLGSVGIEQDMLCRVLERCDFGEVVDKELGDLRSSGLIADAEKKFRYVRYDREFIPGEIEEATRGRTRNLGLDDLELIPFLQQAGRDYAARNVTRSHFFDPTLA